MNYKQIEEEIKDLTILIATAMEEGDEEEHERVVKKIMEIIKAKINQVIDEMIGREKNYGDAHDFQNGYNCKVQELKEYLRKFNE